MTIDYGQFGRRILSDPVDCPADFDIFASTFFTSNPLVIESTDNNIPILLIIMLTLLYACYLKRQRDFRRNMQTFISRCMHVKYARFMFAILYIAGLHLPRVYMVCSCEGGFR